MKNKFGVEIELNSFDNRDFAKNPLKRGELPDGVKEVTNAISNLGLEIQSQSWGYNHNNLKWICKPDASCGIEICSPVFDQDSTEDLILVINYLSSDDRIKIDERCSFHVHADIGSLENFYDSKILCSVLAWWIKCEHVFIDFAVKHRKHNRYCRFIGNTELFDHDENVSTFRLVSKLSDKYLTLNTYHLFNKRRHTLEFRLGEGTKDPIFVRNWISIINNFINSSKNKEPPNNYKWLDHSQVFDFLDFSDDQKQLKNWFLNRLVENCDLSDPKGKYSHTKYIEILDKI